MTTPAELLSQNALFDTMSPLDIEALAKKLVDAFDRYPFVFFNLLLGVLVALQGPLIMMSQNRQQLKDRAQAETDFRVNLKHEVGIETLLREVAAFRGETLQRLALLEQGRQ